MATFPSLMKVAMGYLEKIQGEVELDIYKTIEFDNGVVFVIQSKSFIQTGDWSESLIGIKPFIIDKHDKSIYHRSDLLSVEKLIEDFNEDKNYS